MVGGTASDPVVRRRDGQAVAMDSLRQVNVIAEGVGAVVGAATAPSITATAAGACRGRGGGGGGGRGG